MKIIHLGKLYPPHRGGIETAVRDLAVAGVSLGCTVRCIVSNPGRYKSYSEIVEGVEIDRLATFGKFLSTPLSPGFALGSIPKAEVIHIHLPNPLAELRLLYEIYKYGTGPRPKLVPFVHALPLRQGWLGGLWFSRVTSTILDASDAVLVSHEYQLSAFPMLQKWKDKIRVIPFSAPCIDDAELTMFANLRKTGKGVVAVGRLVKYKGFDVLIKAWARCAAENKEFRNYQLQIIGDGPEYGRLAQLIQEYDLGQSVLLLGNVDDDKKHQILNEAVLFVGPSVDASETFGIAILEAMSRGLPVITTKLSTGVAALARNGECGAIVGPSSVEELSDAIGRLLSDVSMLSFKGQNNLLFVRANHSPEVMRVVYLKMIEELFVNTRLLICDEASVEVASSPLRAVGKC